MGLEHLITLENKEVLLKCRHVTYDKEASLKGLSVAKSGAI